MEAIEIKNITKEFKNEANGKVIYFSKKSKLDDGIIYDDEKIKKCKDKIIWHSIWSILQWRRN